MGGMAVVYEARWLLPGGHHRPVACKLMLEERRGVPLYRELVTQEAALGLRVTHDHPNLVSVFDFFEDAQDRLCIVMELVEGTLKELIGPDRRLPFTVTRRIVKEVLAALVYLHGLGVLHRDLSPCNILVSAVGAVKVSDLGIAKVMEEGQAHTHTFRGKPCYASPEALQTSKLDARSDMYALGTILYELLAGDPPSGDERDPDKILARMVDEDLPPLPPETPQDLAELAMGLLRADPDARRPQSAAEALALLRRHGQPMAGKHELAAMLASAKLPRNGEPVRAGFAHALAPGDVLAPRVLPAQSQSLHSAVPVASRKPKRITEPFIRIQPRSLSLTRTALGAGRRVALRVLWVALVLACGFVLGVLLPGRFRGDEKAASMQRSDAPSQALMETAQPASSQHMVPSASGTAEKPRASGEHIAEPPMGVSPMREATEQAAEESPTSAAAGTRKPRGTRQHRADAASSKEPKNVAPVASIPE